MKPIRKTIIIFLVIGVFATIMIQCGRVEPEENLEALRKEGSRFLNVHDSVTYVGIESCKTCHADIYETFIHTGMGRSYGDADLERSKADWSTHTVVYDSILNLSYQAYVENNRLYVKEYRVFEGDTVHKRIEQVSYVVGSGQHTNSHLMNINGYLYQMPMTYYTQDGKWDLPPGFEKGGNTRFSRAIETECMTCHNALPKQFPGSENKYVSVPQGIDCERCHGPGSLHVQEKLAGKIVDTKLKADYSIVNPRRLSMPLQMSICQRCHTQGNAVLKPGKDFFSFRPGMLLSDVMSVFLPRYEGDQSQFTMASHPDRMMQSACFKESNGAMTCISCHNPHKSIEITPSDHFNSKCQSCHTNAKKNLCTAPENQRKAVKNNCVSCHMPKSGTSDIPHVTITDHWIRKPENQKVSKRSFVGIASINEKRPDALTMAKAWLQYHERFDPSSTHLDSAEWWLQKVNSVNEVAFAEAKVHLAFLRGNFPEITKLSVPKGINGWTWYRIGEAHWQIGNKPKALEAFANAVALVPYQLDFQMKYAVTLHELNKRVEAEKRYQLILEEHPKHAQAMVNYGFLLLEDGNDKAAETWYRRALQLEPDNQTAWMNLVGLYLYRQDMKKAKSTLETILKRYPGQPQAEELMRRITA
jgi:hypothetical protein